MNLNYDDLLLMAPALALEGPDIALLSSFSGVCEALRTSDIRTRTSIAISRQQTVRRLSALVDKGVLERSGSGPQVRYTPNERRLAKAYLDTDRLLRADKPFDIELIRNYLPNETRLMPTALSNELHAVSRAAVKAGDTINRVVFRRYMVDFAWASSKMEGNTYTLLETRSLLEEGIPATGRSAAEAQMLRNHAAAIEYLIDNAHDIAITPMELRGIHAMLSRSLLPNADDEGRVRRSIVEIGQSVYRPSALPQVLDEGLRLIAERAAAIRDPFEQSLFLMVQVSYLQPFIDVNKRTGRVAANIPLLKAGLCPLSFYGMSDDDYVAGLLVYYEVNSAALIADAYRAGYRAAAERYRSYGVRLADDIDRTGAEQRERITLLVKQYLRAVVAGTTARDERDAFLRARIEERSPIDRDALVVTASRAIDQITEVKAMGMGIPKRLFESYQTLLATHGYGAPAGSGSAAPPRPEDK